MHLDMHTHMMKHLSFDVHTAPSHQQSLPGQKVMQLYEEGCVCLLVTMHLDMHTHMIKHLRLHGHTTPSHQQPLPGQKVMQLYEEGGVCLLVTMHIYMHTHMMKLFWGGIILLHEE